MAILDAKVPAWQATTKAISPTKAEALTLEGKAPLTVDGGGFGSNVRVLLKNQTAQAQNGLFEVATNEAVAGTGTVGGSGKVGEGSAWVLTRPSDADSPGDVTEGMLVQIEDGETNQRTSWIQRSPGPIEVGVDAQTFEPLSALPGGQIVAGQLENTYVEPLIKEAVIDNSKVEAAAGISASKLDLKASVASTDLATSAKQSFLQLLTAGDLKLNVGTTKLKWSASALSEAKNVEHGLGKEPVYVDLISSPAPEPGKVPVPNVSSKTSSTFTVNAETKNVHTGEITFLWFAVG